jgi:hypothetical protein
MPAAWKVGTADRYAGGGREIVFGRRVQILRIVAAAALLVLGGALFNFSAVSQQRSDRGGRGPTFEQRLFAKGKRIFRFDTFGDQAFWGGALQLHRAIEGRRLGGVGPGLSPRAALAAGLKVDVRALPRSIRNAIRRGRIDLNSPRTTLALLRLNSVVGVRGFFNRRGTLRSVGITCALCHSTVNDSLAPGIGRRLDGWPNRDLDVGAVRPDGKSGAVLLPAAYGLDGVNLATYTGFGTVTYWNAFVANLEMHGRGNFVDQRLNDPSKFPIATRAGFFNVRNSRDFITPKLGALHFYQLGLKPPKPPRGSYNARRARRGKRVFNGKGTCANCHVPPTFSEPGFNMRRPEEICIDSFQADRSPDGMYRTTPLRGLRPRRKGGFYHDGRFKSLRSVVEHYDGCLGTNLTASEKRDLVEYLKSL